MRRIFGIALLALMTLATTQLVHGAAMVGDNDHTVRQLTLDGNNSWRISGTTIEHYYNYSGTPNWYDRCDGGSHPGNTRYQYEWNANGPNSLTLTSSFDGINYYFGSVSGETIKGSGNTLTVTGTHTGQPGGLVGASGVTLSDTADGNGSALARNTLVVSGNGRIIDGTVVVNRGTIDISGGTITSATITADHNNQTEDTSAMLPGNIGNYWSLSGGAFVDSSLSSTSIVNDGWSGFKISDSASFDSDTTIASAKGGTATSTKTDMVFTDMVRATGLETGFDGTATLTTDNNAVLFDDGANINKNAKVVLKGTEKNTAVLDVGNRWQFKGQVDLSDTAGAVNHIEISSGVMRTDNGDASIIGSIGTYTVNITGGYTAYVDANSGDGTYVFTGGQVYNISDSTAANKTTLGDHTLSYENGGDYLAYSLLNMDSITVKDDANLTIGYNADRATQANDYDIFSVDNNNTIATTAHPSWGPGKYEDYALAGQEAQITAGSVTVASGSKLTIHENAGNWGATGAFNINNSNVINHLEISGVVTLDRTTIHSLTTAAWDPTLRNADFEVKANGTLHGFSQFKTPTNHDPMRPNLVGNLLVHAGGRIQPYDKDLFFLDPAALASNHQQDGNIDKLMGVVMGVQGNTAWDKQSILSTRLFHRNDGTSKMDVDDIVNQQLSYSDSIHSTTFDFSQVWDKNTLFDTREVDNLHKVQYDPVFGFAYELKAKQEFEVYKGDGDPNDKTYYYNVALSKGQTIEEFRKEPGSGGDFMDDANHLFNRDILKSDMLGEWYFLQNDDRDGVVLRFRLLAAHPTQGGIAAGMNEPNAIEAARKIDEMRYPFSTAFPDLGFNPDPSDGLGWGADGYDGNIVEFYKNNQALFDQYDPASIADFDQYLREVQREIASGGTLHEAIRITHAEPYITQTSMNISNMGQFINNRERNAVSALFSVEAANFDAASAQAAAYSAGDAYASIYDDPEDYEYTADMFVINPIRFWASGFGTDAKTKKRGTEYGYDTEIYGGSLGVVKEFRDIYAGFTIGFARSSNSWTELSANSRTRHYMAEALLGVRKGMGFLEFHANYSWNDNKLTRHLYLNNNYDRTAYGDYNDHTFALGMRLGYQKVICDSWLLIPTIGLQYYRNDNFSDFTERSNQPMFSRLKFKSGAFRRHQVKVPIMARLNRSFALWDMVVTPEVRVGATVTMGQRAGSMKYEFGGNPVSGRFMKAIGYDPGAVSGQLGASVELSRHGRMYVAANYDYYFAKRAHSHNYSLQTGLNF